MAVLSGWSVSTQRMVALLAAVRCTVMMPDAAHLSRGSEVITSRAMSRVWVAASTVATPVQKVATANVPAVRPWGSTSTADQCGRTLPGWSARPVQVPANAAGTVLAGAGGVVVGSAVGVAVGVGLAVEVGVPGAEVVVAWLEAAAIVPFPATWVWHPAASMAQASRAQATSPPAATRRALRAAAIGTSLPEAGGAGHHLRRADPAGPGVSGDARPLSSVPPDTGKLYQEAAPPAETGHHAARGAPTPS